MSRQVLQSERTPELPHLQASNPTSSLTACSRPDLVNDSQELTLFTVDFPRLQEMRHHADNDPVTRFNQAEAATAVNTLMWC